MRIGIITFHQAYNYGAVLQCYALCSVLKKMGCEVEVIDYIPKCFDAQHKLWSWYIFKKRNIFGKVEYLYSSLKGLRIRYSRNRKFNNFIKELPLTPFSTLDEWSEKQKFDIIFWGSDQVWNPMITGSIDLVYFGKFKKNNTVFASYAASTQKDAIINYDNEFKNLFHKFDYISVREKWLQLYFSKLGYQRAKVVLDPVLLLTSERWPCVDSHKIEDKYILIYTVPQNELVNEVADRLAKKHNCKIIELVANIKSQDNKRIQDASPQEFLGYFKNAHYIVTTSFHGTAFSIIFRRPFYTISCNKNVDDRAQSLLEQLDLDKRLITSVPGDEDSEINFNIVDNKLQSLREESFDYIRQVLNSK